MLFFRILGQWFSALQERSITVLAILLALLLIIYFFPAIVSVLPFTYLAL